MSVNGDSTIMRHGRSQISIYDYPEHLNPFYEDENHKRLRFWKIGKSKDETGRRSSFSLGGIKDMWAFKSFRLKKKSSTLGINKTSESPPPLRRQLDPSQCNYGTYDPRMRHTTTTNGGYSNTFERNTPYRSSLQDMRLGPGAQQQQQQNGFGFARNDRYRSTIQTPQTSNYRSPIVPPRRYVYGGSVTPQPIRNSGYRVNDDSQGISRGSSQVSVSSSTNPFEDNNDDDDVVIGHIENGSATAKKRYAHKKKRAPAPPVPVQVIREDVSIDSKTTSHLHIDEEEYLPVDEILNISSLTAEIESFVQTSKDDNPNSDRKKSSPSKEIQSVTPPPIINLVKTESSPEKNLSNKNETPDCHTAPKTIIITEQRVKQETNEPQGKIEKTLNKKKAPVCIIETKKHTSKVLSNEGSPVSNITVVQMDQTENTSKLLPHQPEEEIDDVIPTKEEPNNNKISYSQSTANENVNTKNVNTKNVTSDQTQNIQDAQLSQKVSVEPDDSLNSSTKMNGVVNKKEDNSNSPLILKIKETEETVLKITENSPQFSETTQIEYVPLKDSSNKIESHLLRPKESPPKPPKPSFDSLSTKREIIKSKNDYFPLKPLTTDNDLFRSNPISSEKEQIAPVPRERRRSVRDIIESINRNQKLLKVNQETDPEADANNSKYIFYTHNMNEQMLKAPPRKKIDQNYRSLEESEREIKRMLHELETPLNNSGDKLKNSEFYGNGNNETLNDLVEQLNHNNDNNNANLFEKCTLKKDVINSRESSPTTSNLDWNPVPKPKRTKNLSPEFKLNNNHSGNNNGHHFTYDH